jgi:hypothetical protein
VCATLDGRESVSADWLSKCCETHSVAVEEKGCSRSESWISWIHHLDIRNPRVLRQCLLRCGRVVVRCEVSQAGRQSAARPVARKTHSQRHNLGIAILVLPLPPEIG